MSVLNDRLLAELKIENAKINPASIDLSLSNFMRRAKWYWRLPRWLVWIIWRYIFRKPDPWNKDHADYFWGDPESFGSYWHIESTYDSTFWLWPGELILLSSAEYVKIPEDKCGLLVTTSTTGRVGLNHSHSGWLDPGFEGHVTFEYCNITRWPIPLKRGRITIQVIIMSLVEAPQVGYKEVGRYNNQSVIPQIQKGGLVKSQ